MIDRCFSILLVMVQANFFYATFLPSFFYRLENYHTKYLTTLILILWLLWRILSSITGHNKLVRQGNKNRGIYTFAFLYSFWILVSIFSTMFQYGLSLRQIASGYLYMIVPVLMLLIGISLDSQTIRFLFRTIMSISTVYAFLLIMQSLLWSKGKIFLQIANDYQSLNSSVQISGPFLRIMEPGDFLVLALLTSLIMSFQKLHFKCLPFVVFLQFFTITFVCQTRMYVLICLALLMIWLLYKIPGLSKGVWTLLLLSLAVLAIISIPVVDDIFGFTSGARVASYNVRLEEITYYLDLLFKSPYFGIGFPPDNATFFGLLHGPFSQFSPHAYYLDDIGILGSIVQFGLPFCLILLVLLFSLVKRAILNPQFYVLSSATYLMLLLPTLSPFNPQRIFTLGMLICILFFQKKELLNSSPKDEYNTIDLGKS